MAGAGCNRKAVESAAPHISYRADVTQTSASLPIDAQWSGWRGGLHHGVSTAVSLPTRWSEREGVRWKVDVPGRGNSSPVAWGDHLFVTSATAGEHGEQASLMCFDRATGSLRWETPIGAPQGPSHSKNGFASATPATDGRHVFAVFGSLGIAAIDFSGKIAWHAPLAQHRHTWGTAASPVLFENLVIHVVDGESDSAIIAWEKTTGQQVWRTPRSSHGSWSSPVLVNAGTDVAPQWEVVVNGTGAGNAAAGELIAYDPRTGQSRWTVTGTSDIPCPTAIVGEGIVVSSSGSNGPVFAVRPGGRGDVADTHGVWERPSGGPYVPTGLIYQQRLYMISDSGMLVCQRLEDGEVVWKKRLQGAFSASLVAGANQVYAVNERGDVYVFKAGDRFELLATSRLHEPTVATPAIAHGELYLRTQQHLYCIAEVNIAATEPADVAPAVVPVRSPGDIEPAAILSPATNVERSTLTAPN